MKCQTPFRFRLAVKTERRLIFLPFQIEPASLGFKLVFFRAYSSTAGCVKPAVLLYCILYASGAETQSAIL